MKLQYLLALLSAAAIVGPASAQNERQAAIVGGNSQNGRCVADVVVDGRAQIQIQGDRGRLVDIKGRQPKWHSFECTSPMPANATDLRLSANGRGQVELVQMPGNSGGPAVVYIQDPGGGAHMYHVELMWNNAASSSAGYYNGQPDNGYYNNDRYDNRRGLDRSETAAVDLCQAAIQRQAQQTFNTDRMHFENVYVDNNRGRRDRVLGTLDVPGSGRYGFSCSVNLNNGRVRSARLQLRGNENRGYAGRDIDARAMDSCRTALYERLGNDVQVGDMNIENNGDRSVVTGNARAHGDHFGYSCEVNSYNGNLRGLQVWGR